MNSIDADKIIPVKSQSVYCPINPKIDVVSHVRIDLLKYYNR